jgi:L-2-hydroxyglutarate oxidase LhgO
VIGCAVAEALARRGLDVALLEGASQAGGGLTSRNSGVVHSGLYYEPDSLKARACVGGQRALYAWAEAHGVAHERCGKLVVASSEAEICSLEALHVRAQANGARGLEWIDRAEACAREPCLENTAIEAALWCPWTGIVDPHELTDSLRREAARLGATVAFGAEVTDVALVGDAWTVETARGRLESPRIVNATGLYADRLATRMGIEGYAHRYSRGDYFRWHGARPFRHLIYPVRQSGSAGLGVHLTIDLAGGVRFGPDARWVDDPSDLTPAQHLLPAFQAQAERLVGPLDRGRLAWESCGVRPKLHGPDGEPMDDLLILPGPAGSVHLLGMESPGLTAALFVAEEVADQVA